MFKGVDKETIFQWTVEILNKFIDRLLIRELMNARGVIQKSATLRGCKESHFQYLVCPPLASMQAAHRPRMLRIRFLMVC